MVRQRFILIAIAAAVVGVVAYVVFAKSRSDASVNQQSAATIESSKQSASHSPSQPSLQNPQPATDSKSVTDSRSITERASGHDLRTGAKTPPPEADELVERVPPVHPRSGTTANLQPHPAIAANIANAKAAREPASETKKGPATLKPKNTKADLVPGTSAMRDQVLANRCSGPSAQQKYNQLSQAERLQMKKQCGTHGSSLVEPAN